VPDLKRREAKRVKRPRAAAWFPKLEREFLQLAGTMLACTLEVQGGKIPGRKLYRIEGARTDLAILRRNLEFSALGLVDHYQEIRLLCREAFARTNETGPGGI
jgi:hypothetical protein